MSSSPRDTTRIKIISVAFALVIIAAGGFVIFRSHGSGDPQPTNLTATLPSAQSPGQTGYDSSGQELDPNEQTSDRFTHPDYGFSFELPEGSRPTVFQDDASDVVLVEGEDPKQNFQIFIAPFDLSDEALAKSGEPFILTPQRIKKDLPQKLVKNPKTGKLAGVPFLTFESQEPDAGATFELWFVHDSHLYQFRSPLTFQKSLEGVLLPS
jgi:hypothetical protein